MKEKKYKPIMTTAEKKLLTQKKIIAIISVLVCVSVVLNVIYIANIKVPVVNPDGKKIESQHKEKDNDDSILKQIIKDNTKFENFTSISLDTESGIYFFSKMNKVCRLYGMEGWDFEYCDFEIAKWDELKAIVLKYQLNEYDPNKHVDSEGRIQNYDEEYTLELTIDGKSIKMEVPDNISEIEDYLIKITDLARTK